MVKYLIGLLATCICVWSGPVLAQISCTTSLTQSQLLNQFSDSAAPNSITPGNIRNIICNTSASGVPTGNFSTNSGAIVAREPDRLFVGLNTNVNNGAKDAQQN